MRPERPNKKIYQQAEHRGKQNQKGPGELIDRVYPLIDNHQHDDNRYRANNQIDIGKFVAELP